VRQAIAIECWTLVKGGAPGIEATCAPCRGHYHGRESNPSAKLFKVALAFRFDRLVAGIAYTEAPLAFGLCSLAGNKPPSEPLGYLAAMPAGRHVAYWPLATDHVLTADGRYRR
jgi:hypothetical protein